MTKVVIYRAADAFLYLPIYIAEHTDVFKTKNPGIDIDFRTAGKDHLAIKKMIDEKHENSSHIPIALCDPMAIFDNPQFSQHNQPENLKVIGTLIDKPPFWAVSIRDERFNTMEGTANHFEEVICYQDDELITGYYIGKQMRDESGIRMINNVGFRKEMAPLLDEAETSGKFCVVTVDIIRLAQAQHSGKKVYLNYRFSERFDKFLTSCLITTNEVCEKYPEILKDVLEGIQRSIFMFRSSESIARDVCQIVNSQIITKGGSKDKVPLENGDPRKELERWCHKKLSDPIIENQKSGRSWLVVDKVNGNRYLAEKEENQICLRESPKSLMEADISWIVEQFHRENFYPNDLLTPEDKWKASIEARHQAQIWKKSDTEKRKKKYDDIVENQFARQAQASIIEEIGGNSPQKMAEDFAKREEEMMDKLATHKKEMEEGFAKHKDEVKKDFANHEEKVEESFAKHKETVEKGFVKHEEVHRKITPFLLGSMFLLLLLLFWFPDLTGKLVTDKHEQIRAIKIVLSGLFGSVFIFRIVFWNKNWFYICWTAGVVVVSGIVLYFFSGPVSSIISGTISGLIVWLISRKVESRKKKSEA